MKGSMAEPQPKEETMKVISKADLYDRTNHELDGLKEEFRKVADNCEQTRREAYAAIQDVLTVQGQRRITRPNH
jgi:ABC-type Zn uptake system ZnuABC Zn-binding protein ZnuA